MKPRIRAVIIPRLNYKQSYIHVDRIYEGRKVKSIRDESVVYPNQTIPVYSVYDDNEELICTLESCPIMVYYYSSKEIGVS